MPYELSYKSIKNLSNVHPDLAALVRYAITVTKCDFVVYDGLRTMEKQLENIKRGVSWSTKSRHLTGHAVDLVPLVGIRPSWDYDGFILIHDAMKQASKALNIPFQWGGNRVHMHDGSHYQLPLDKYPK